ncbi:MAG: hypothetical protein LBU32_21500 [Clostridiales bacterium]|jgi:hypothetical protein|nr:hypothetical protein [Clostridiales bacterium]
MEQLNMTKKLSLWELVLVTWQVYRRNFFYLTVTCLLAYTPVLVTMLFVPVPTTQAAFETAALNPDQLRILMRSSLIIIGLYLLFVPPYTSAVTEITLLAIINEKVSAERIFDASLAKWIKLIVTSLVYFILIFITAVFILPAIFIAVAFYFYPSFTALGGSWGLNALRRSFDAVKGRWFRTLGFIIAINIFSMLAMSLTQAAFGWAPYNAATVVIISIIGQIVCAFFSVMSSVWLLNILFMLKGKAA